MGCDRMAEPADFYTLAWFLVPWGLEAVRLHITEAVEKEADDAKERLEQSKSGEQSKPDSLRTGLRKMMHAGIFGKATKKVKEQSEPQPITQQKQLELQKLWNIASQDGEVVTEEDFVETFADALADRADLSREWWRLLECSPQCGWRIWIWGKNDLVPTIFGIFAKSVAGISRFVGG